MLLGDLEQRAGVDLGDLLHGLAAAPFRPDSAAKSSSASASSTGGCWSSSVERLARDLLGGQHGEVGDLVADLLDRAARLVLDVAARVCSSSSSRCCAGLGDRLSACVARPPCARARRCRRPARAPRAAARGTPRAARRPPARARSAASIESSIAFAALVERLRDPRERDLAEHVERDAEGDQRPDHQPEARADEEAAAAVLAVGLRRGRACRLARHLEEEGDQAEDDA